MGKIYTIDDIQSISMGEHIQLRPRMHFQMCFDEKALDSLLPEVLCHALDEHLDGKCNTIQIEVFTDSFRVDYKTGISLELAQDNCTIVESIMTKIYACKNEKKHLIVSGEFCELGMATINFASEKCELITISNGKKGLFSFQNGALISKEISDSDAPETTSIFVYPNKALLQNLLFTSKGIHEKLEALKQKLPGLKIEIQDRIQ